MNKIVPLIGSAEVGPLGVLHLPRLWLKVSLDGRGLLVTDTRPLDKDSIKW